METKELKIEIPLGYEIDKEKTTFEKIVFKKKGFKPKSWEEYCEKHRNEVRYVAGYDLAGGYNIIQGIYGNGYCTVPSKELAETFVAMMQLISLREDWIHKWSVDNGMTDDWKPDWDSTLVDKHCITNASNKSICVDIYVYTIKPLSFPTYEMAEDFMNCFKDLLEIAKPLI